MNNTRINGTRQRAPLIKHRARDRGATMFIVMMIVMILSAIGTFALTNARFEVQTAGFTRQQTAAKQLADLGANTTIYELSTSPAAYLSRLRLSGSYDATKKEVCQSNAGLLVNGQLPPCYHLYPSDLETRSTIKAKLVQAPTATDPGSLGLNDANGGFSIELTDPLDVVRPVQGAPIDGSPGTPRFIDVTITSTGVVFSDFSGGAANGIVDDPERSTATFVSGRGHIIVGPIYGSL